MEREFQSAIKEYNEAVQENILASAAESVAKDRKRKAHNRLLRARDELRAMERELLDKTNTYEPSRESNN